ncbi:sarcosine oxidase subunit delta [Sphingomonas sp. SRS2]|uniref:sarcosine oxidase subunit delta n=1 Tax=Sphingomonas sp. SRS2 TaxID=133190 RepID=UPI0006184152|nr:sarcosine oxidase subunit delta [Sphingomonas sp. SRS2]KKC24783.1 sarcosine oxidase subunit delta [Sphingomonas sp. SRS2]
MLRIHCPVCGVRDETEFTYGGDATVKRPDMAEADPQVWVDYVFMRDNPRGPHSEYWHHVAACRQWLVVERDTLTHDIGSVRLAREAAL